MGLLAEGGQLEAAPNVLYTETLYSSVQDSTAGSGSIVASRRIRISPCLIPGAASHRGRSFG